MSEIAGDLAALVDSYGCCLQGVRDIDLGEGAIVKEKAVKCA